MQRTAHPAWWHSGRMIAAALIALCALLPTTHAQETSPFRVEEIDQMLAPIALYPDSLLSQILMASTYPADVADAAKWSKAHPTDKGDAAVSKVESQDWDPSVKSLVAFPQVLAMMGEKPRDVQRLGDAFLADAGLVMDRVQFLRTKAQEAGNLKSNDQQKVVAQTVETKQVIVIEPAQPQTVYVPVYQPTVVYGPWWYPSYPPYYWPPPPYYYPGAAFVGGVIWGAAVVGINNSLWGGFGWGRNEVNINVNRYNSINVNNRITDVNANKFVHNPEHRRDVPYRDAKSRDQFSRKQAGSENREEFRGKEERSNVRDSDRARAQQAMQDRGVAPAGGRDRPSLPQGDQRGAANRDPSGRGPDHAMSNVRNPDAMRDFDRAKASRESMDQGMARPSAQRPSHDARPSPAARPSSSSGARPANAARPASGGRAGGGHGRR